MCRLTISLVQKEMLSQGYHSPLLFNLFINDLTFFIEQCTLRNYADDNNLSISGEDKELIKSMLSSDFMIVEEWLLENYMILNPEKCYFMCIRKNVSDSELLNLNDLNLKNCKLVGIFDITIDRNLNFKGHIKNISRKAGQKLSALLRISLHITLTKKLYFTNQLLNPSSPTVL